jgi:AcrR family transcriptional regulator
LTVRLVAAEAGLSGGLVLFHFKTKERLVSALLGHTLATGRVAQVMKDLQESELPLARLQSVIRLETIRLTSEPRRIRLLIEYWVKGFSHPFIRTRMRAEFRRYREVFRPTAAAVVAADPDRFRRGGAEGLAAVAVGVIKGCAVQSVIDPRSFDVDRYLSAVGNLIADPG